MAKRMTTAEKRHKVLKEYLISVYQNCQREGKYRESFCIKCIDEEGKEECCSKNFFILPPHDRRREEIHTYSNKMEYQIERRCGGDIREWFWWCFDNDIGLDNFKKYILTKNKTTQKLFESKKHTNFSGKYVCEFLGYEENGWGGFRRDHYECEKKEEIIDRIMDIVEYSKFSLK
jgi:hypothetical protein